MRHVLSLVVIVVVFGVPFCLTRFPKPPESPQLCGVVSDGQHPIEGARVRVVGSNLFTFSDSAGQFRLQRPPGTGKITAAKEGYFIAGISTNSNPLIINLEPIPAGDCERYAWVEPGPDPAKPGNCGNCHREIHEEWQAGGHAHAATNRRFRNLYDGTDWHGRANVGWNLLQEHPDGAGVCTACHGPTLPTEPFDIRLATASVPSGLSGVHCDFCHKVVGAGPGEWGLTHGRYQLELRRPDPAKIEQLFFGPLDDVARGDDSYSPFQRDSRFCAACHEGVVFGVPVYTTYSEWQQSPARREGKSCQSCHMAPTGRTNIAPGRGGLEREPKTLGNHHFFAGSQQAMLERCLKLTATAKRQGDTVSLEVQLIAEGVGHRVPTGFIDRHLIVQVEADQPLLRGPKLSAWAGKEWAGQPGRIYAKRLQPDSDGIAIPFWKAEPGRVWDTRLEPGIADQSQFAFPANTRSLNVRVWHRRFWREVELAKGWPRQDLLIVERNVPILEEP